MKIRVKMWGGAPSFEMTVRNKEARQLIGKALSRGYEFGTYRKVNKYLQKCAQLLGHGSDVIGWQLIEY